MSALWWPGTIMGVDNLWRLDLLHIIAAKAQTGTSRSQTQGSRIAARKQTSVNRNMAKKKVLSKQAKHSQEKVK